MKKYWRVSTITIMAMVVCGILFLPIETRAEGCDCPELGNLIDDSRDLLGLTGDTIPMARGICLQPSQKGTDIQWFGVALEEPMGGALFALDCSGKVLAASRIGSVVKLVVYPPLGDFNAVVKVDYIAKVAQGYGLIIYLKDKGYPLFLLSNTNELHFSYIIEKYPIVHSFDEWLLSFEIGAKKPKRRIFDSIFEKKDVQPSEVLYIDDISHYVETAQRLGISGIVFRHADQLWEFIRKHGI